MFARSKISDIARRFGDTNAPGVERENVGTGWALAALAMSSLLAAIGTSVANVGLPALAHAFAVSFNAVQWVVLSYLLAITTLIVGVGRFGDLFGRRRVLLVGIAVFTLASAACMLAPTLATLIAFRALQGAGAAIMMALAMALVTDMVGAAKSATALGLLGTTSAAGTAIGPTVGGILLQHFGWRALFGLTIPLGFVTWVLAVRYLIRPTRNDAKMLTFDWIGTFYLALALGAFALAMSGIQSQTSLHTAAWLVLAVSSALLFSRRQRATASPLIRVAMLGDRALRASLTANALVATVMMSTLIVGPFYLARSLQLDAAQVGLAMSAGPLVAAMSGVPAGRAVDRFGWRSAALTGLLIVSGGTTLLALRPLMTGAAGYVAPMAVLTAGYALFQTANNAAVMGSATTPERGAVSALLNLSRNLGLITGASVMGAVFAFGAELAGTDAPPAVASTLGMRLTYALATVLVIAALIAGARIPVRAEISGNQTEYQM